MSNETSNRPNANEYNPYYKGYVDLADTEDILSFLVEAKAKTIEFFRSIPAEKWNFRYAPGKWSLKESWIHLIDSERVFAYRLLRISRNDPTPLAGFDQNDYVPYYLGDDRSVDSVIEEYAATREATIQLIKNLSEEAWTRIGTASDSPVSVRALAYFIGGHEVHHLNLSKERYL